jgi:NADPH:quinone reductase-like Zn-dependent oxidoreductase
LSSESKKPGLRIVRYRSGDPRGVLRIGKVIDGRPLVKGEVLVRVSCSVSHPGDLQLVTAKYSQPQEFPQGRVPGFEAAGIVEKAAPAALDGTGISIGMRVAFFAPGAWQTHAIVPADSLIAIPNDLPDSIATQVLVNTITARHVQCRQRRHRAGQKRQRHPEVLMGARNELRACRRSGRLSLPLIPVDKFFELPTLKGQS